MLLFSPEKAYPCCQMSIFFNNLGLSETSPTLEKRLRPMHENE